MVNGTLLIENAETKQNEVFDEYYEIDVSLNGRCYFATEERSFPADEGFETTTMERTRTGTHVDI